MADADEISRAVRAALEVDPHVNLHASTIEVEHHAGMVSLAGEVPDIAAKRRAVLAAGAVAGVRTVEDRLRVRPADAMGDGEIRDHVRNVLLSEPAFADHDLRLINQQGEVEVLRALDEPHGDLVLSVEDGVVTLGGNVWSPAHRRLAGVLAWWVPGSRDVVNTLQVTPAQQDNDGEISDVVRLVLEKDRFVDPGQISTRVKDSVVTLDGSVAGQEQKRIAEYDVWYIEGVRDVVNHLVTP